MSIDGSEIKNGSILRNTNLVGTIMTGSSLQNPQKLGVNGYLDFISCTLSNSSVTNSSMGIGAKVLSNSSIINDGHLSAGATAINSNIDGVSLSSSVTDMICNSSGCVPKVL